MASEMENKLITDISRRVVIDVAPLEKRSFNAISEAYFKNPEKALKGEGAKDELMGVGGVGELIILLTPIILEVVKEVLKDLLKDSVKAPIQKHGSTLLEKIRIFVGKLFGTIASQPAQPQYLQLLIPLKDKNLLSKDQMKHIHKRAYESSLKLGVDANKATQIADSIISSLNLSI